MGNDRGDMWEFDPGPPRNRKWPRLFSETPNYRGLGEAVMGFEKFRWHFGPMYYRGRLSDDQVKVLVVGQEGASDESLSHRSFTGSSGARLQNVLNHIGITRSYLFLNTFVYPIFQQYSGAGIRWLAQDPASPVRQQRHEILDYVIDRNDLRLVIAVGNAAKESVQSWIESRGGSCPDGIEDLTTADGHVLGAATKVVGVIHPGAARGTRSEAVIEAFRSLVAQVHAWADADPGWLPPDDGGVRVPVSDFEYVAAPIPRRDLPFGISASLGRGATTSTRTDDQRGIQLAAGSGSNSSTTGYPQARLGSSEGYSDGVGDVPYEPPVADYRHYDRGPDPSFARLLSGSVPGYEWPDFASLGATIDPGYGLAGFYRGRPRRASAIVLADQRSDDDLFTGRALTGEAGQRFQQFLEAMGLVDSYLILRVLPVDVLGLSRGTRNAIVDDPQVVKVYAEILERVVAANRRQQVLLAMGPMARRLAPNVRPSSLELVELPAWHGRDATADWNAALAALSQLDYDRDAAASFTYDGSRGQIPRRDLPYGTLRWWGTSGTRATRPSNGSQRLRKYLQPQWVFETGSDPLDAGELAAVADHD